MSCLKFVLEMLFFKNDMFSITKIVKCPKISKVLNERNNVWDSKQWLLSVKETVCLEFMSSRDFIGEFGS